jgi:hypothetical protein
MNKKKPIAISPITDNTRAMTSCGKFRLKLDTANVQPASINTHSNSEPSCEPQDAVTL